MKKIETLVSDIYEVVSKGVSGELDAKAVQSFADDLVAIIVSRLGERQSGSYLRPSNIGEKCDRKLWFAVNKPELGEDLSPETKLKFLIGDIHEAVLLFLAETAGHLVEGRQDNVSVGDVVGSRDAVIDGVLTDVKSASSYSFQKFDSHLTPEEDAFGYINQINFYLEGSQDDDTVQDKDRAAFLVSDKTLGKITLDVHERAGIDFSKLIASKREMLASDKLPPRGYQPVPEGKSGNEKLGIACSYCPFKRACWPGLRVFLYSTGPVFLVTVKREPNVTEIF